MKRALQAAFAVSLVTLASAAAMAASCMAVTQGSVTVDGVVVPRPGVTAAPGCPSAAPDRGWGGVIGENLVAPPGRTRSSQEGQLFLAAQEEGGKVKRVILGLRVANAPDFTVNDKFAIYFQADGSAGNWNAANDFALVFGGIGPLAATPLGRDGCASVGNQPLLYRRDAQNTTWVPQSAIPAGISFGTSFDYETVRDPQTETWQLEVAVDLSLLNPGLTITRGGQIGFGGKLYLFNTGVGATTPLYFPAQVAPNDPFLDANPNQGGVTPATLEKITVGGCLFNVVIQSVNITSASGAEDTFTLLNSSDFDSTGNLATDKQSLLQATVRFVNPADPHDRRLAAMPNAGTVKFSFDGQISATGDPPGQPFLVPVHSSGASFGGLGESVVVELRWPPNNTEYACCDGFFRFSFVRRLVIDITDFNADQPGDNQVALPFAFGD